MRGRAAAGDERGTAPNGRDAHMKLSARNAIPGTVADIKVGPVSAEVTIRVAAGIDIVSVISSASVQELGLKVGTKAFAVIKASSVMVGVDHP
jgi:molybdate transport system regulatory protein